MKLGKIVDCSHDIVTYYSRGLIFALAFGWMWLILRSGELSLTISHCHEILRTSTGREGATGYPGTKGMAPTPSMEVRTVTHLLHLTLITNHWPVWVKMIRRGRYKVYMCSRLGTLLYGVPMLILQFRWMGRERCIRITVGRAGWLQARPIAYPSSYARVLVPADAV